MIALQSDFTVRFPQTSFVMTRTDNHTLFCYSSYETFTYFTLEDKEFFSDGKRAYQLVQSPYTDEYFVMDYNGRPINGVAFQALQPTYCQKLKLFCFTIPCVADKDLFLLASSQDENPNCRIKPDELYRIGLVDYMFDKYKKIVVYTDEKERQNLIYNFIAGSKLSGYLEAGYSKENISNIQWVRSRVSDCMCGEPLLMTQAEVLDQYSIFYKNFKDVEFVHKNNFKDWVKTNYNIDINLVSDLEDKLELTPIQEAWLNNLSRESDARVQSYIKNSKHE